MTTFAEVRFAHEDGALADTFASTPELDVRILPETSTDPEREIYVLKCDAVAPDVVAEALERDRTVETVHPMPEFDRRNLWGVTFAETAVLLGPQVTRHGGFVIDARSAASGLEAAPRGWHEQWLLPDREALHDVWEHAREAGFTFEVVDVRQLPSADAEYPVRDALTEKQREALVVAYELGYFADPREASLAEVAAELGYSASAVGGRLKRGIRALIERTLLVDRSDRPHR
ncbi:helix-turn-helix domain-containing protein [Halopenitus sp. POP-27]|uniref:helix-turn-helix domain-containing protein n=1 Tax=Halopenitus sp. POP-27 TaxID=2994425 RepID=UPI0024690B88|nr:helix-turn-helix domain-containing protein [Halopenitus sp. POP-27]